jgi:hypothetical protein
VNRYNFIKKHHNRCTLPYAISYAVRHSRGRRTSAAPGSGFYTFSCAARGRLHIQGGGGLQPRLVRAPTHSPAQPGVAFTFKEAADFSRAWFGLLHIFLRSQGSPSHSRGRRTSAAPGSGSYTFSCAARGRLHIRGGGGLQLRLVQAPTPSPAQPRGRFRLHENSGLRPRRIRVNLL